jgi:hypothetical protein
MESGRAYWRILLLSMGKKHATGEIKLGRALYLRDKRK